MSLTLDDLATEAREVLREELAEFAAAQRNPVSRELYRELVSAVDAGEVPDHLVNALETFLELALHRGRLRRERGAEADEALTDLFYRTPTGAAARKAAHDVTRGLAHLAGHVLERIAVVAYPGGHSVTLQTDRAEVTLELDRGGARVKSVEVTA